MQALRLEERQATQQQPFQDEQLQLMTANLLKIKRQITQRNDKIQENDNLPTFQRENVEKMNINKQIIAPHSNQLCQQIREAYQEYLANASLPNNHQQKLSYLLECEEQDIGTTIALFQMLYYFRDVISQEILEQITNKSFQRLQRMGSKINNAEKHCLMELIAICGVYHQQIISYVVQQMIEATMDFQLAFIVLSNMGYKGFQVLINLAKEDFKETPILILNYLAKTEEIIRQLLIPTLVDDLNNAKSKGRQKDIILSILNRFNESLSSSQKIFSILTELMQSNTNDRGFIASVLRSCGSQGEKILLQFMNQYPTNEKIMLPIVSVLPWRVPTQPVLRIKVIQYTLGSNFLPGTLYQYQGNIQPSAFCFQQDDCCDSLCINARDFIAALNRMLNFKLENFENEQMIRKGSINNIKLFSLYEVVGRKQQQLPSQINTQVIKSLNKCLQNPKPQIRQAAINSLGLIGLPQAFQSIQQISKCLWDKDSRNRSMACWAISKICQNPTKKIIKRLIQLLKDSFWKVRISSCICIGAIIKQPYENVLEALVKCLKDNSINKLTVCETIIKLGLIGQQILLQILKNSNPSDFKIRQAVIHSLKDADVRNPHIDFVLQQIFKHCKGNRVETRICCLQTLNHLRSKATQQGQNIVYLKAKTILPFYYYFLEDPSIKIRQMATQSIFSFGNQAELIFIQGIAKGSQMVRIQSAKGLGQLGIQNFRALILGLRDQDLSVRQITTNVILNKFTAEDVGSYYSTKVQQIPSLLCNLKDILSGSILPQQMKSFIKQAIICLERINKQTAYSFNGSKNKNENNKQSFLYQSSKQ